MRILITTPHGVWSSNVLETLSDEDAGTLRTLAENAVTGELAHLWLQCENKSVFFGKAILQQSIITLEP